MFYSRTEAIKGGSAMRLIKACLIVLLLFAPSFGSASGTADIPKAEHVPFLGMEAMAQKVKPTVFAVQIQGNTTNSNPDDDWISLGTGFFVVVDPVRIWGVTCRHVAMPAINAKKQIYAGVDTKNGYIRVRCEDRHIDKDHDIAVLIPQATKATELLMVENVAWALGAFAHRDSYVEGRALLMPGYPLGVGIAENKNRPVVRLGMIAQYAGGNTFLIDGVASHGNSGSPVVLIREGGIAGMLISHVADTINLFDENHNLRARLPYNSGLGVALTSEVIAKVLRKIKPLQR
jgi:S1-C subfamily serine protease